MRFKTDEHIHGEIAEFLRTHGHDALTLWDQSLAGSSDGSISGVCQHEKRALVTLDTDFADIRTYPPHLYPGIIVLRLTLQSRRAVLAACGRLLLLLESEPLTGHLWIVDETSVRIRGTDPL